MYTKNRQLKTKIPRLHLSCKISWHFLKNDFYLLIQYSVLSVNTQHASIIVVCKIVESV